MQAKKELMPKTKPNQKECAKSIYLSTNETLEEIANKVGVSRQSIARWIKQDGWESIKSAQDKTPEEFINDWSAQIAEINKNIIEREEGKRFATPAEADAMRKLQMNIKEMKRSISLTDTIEVLKKFTAWLRIVDAEEAKHFTGYFDAFVKDNLR